MKKTALAAALGALLPTAALAAPWSLDGSHTTATFNVKHMMMTNVRGEFRSIKGTVDLDDADLTKSKVEVTIDAASVDTRDAKRDDHLKSPDFFDVKNQPNVTFKSKKVKKGAGGKFDVVGDLTIRGITKEVTLAVEAMSPSMQDPWGNERRGGRATAVVNRKDFGMTWNKTLDKGGVLVGEEVQIVIDFEVIKAKG